MLTRDLVKRQLVTYQKAWQQQDADLILSIFTSDAVYHERTFDQPYVGHEAIRHYWQTKVIAAQANIEFALLHLYIDGDVAIAEWEASFDDRERSMRRKIQEVAILEFQGELIRSLREYWHGTEA